MTERYSIPATLAASVLLHLLGLFCLARLTPQLSFPTTVILPVTLIDTQIEAPPQSAPQKLPPAEQSKGPAATTVPQPKVETTPVDKPQPPPSAVRLPQETPAPSETKALPSSLPAAAMGPVRPDGGGSETGGATISGKSEVGIVAGTASGGAGGGTAIAGSGRGSGAPGLAGQGQPARTNREARPIQNIRANYPAMALRAGLESDVGLKIEVDAQGNVTKAEIVRSGGAGFDEEALKAIKQARFEPAQRDGQHVAAEFNYVYRFRLQR